MHWSGHGRPPEYLATDTTDERLRDVRDDVVRPVVASVVRDDELESLTIYREAGVAPEEIWIRLVARGEEFVDLLSSPSWEGETRAGAQEIGSRLLDHLEDWVCQTGFAWGERRQGTSDGVSPAALRHRH